jgi:two-component system, cell cycle sensor histidine kinase and response regulator CckA
MREIARLFSVVEGERRYFQELAANLPQALAVFEARSTLAWSNAAFRRLFPAETSATYTDALPTPSLRLAAKKILEGGREPLVEQHQEGERTLRFTVAPSDNWATEPEVLVQVEDLSAPVDAARRETAAHYAPLEVITWELDPVRMEFLRVDTLAAERLGFDPDTWSRGRSFWSRILVPGELARVRTHYQTAVQADASSCEYHITDRHGRLRWLRDSTMVVQGRVLGVSQEITHDKDREQSTALGQRIAAQRALAGAVAHDNNNLLMILRGYSEDLLHGLSADSPLRSNVKEIVAATERLAAHTKILAAFTAKQPAPVPETVALDAFLSEQREAVTAALPAGSELTLEPASTRANVSVDPKCFAILLRTLATSLRGGVRIATSRAGDKLVRLSMRSSTGHAPPADAFEVSARPSSPMGPALHLAYEFLRNSGGDVIVRDTGYEILLPRMADSVQTERAKDVVLVVDDEESIRSLVRKVLERAGYSVIEAESGEAALKASLGHAGPISLLLSDVVMPGMGGVELAENLSLRRPEMRTLLISGYTGETALASARLPRGFEFLQKPFSLPDLLGKVKTLVDRGR